MLQLKTELAHLFDEVLNSMLVNEKDVFQEYQNISEDGRTLQVSERARVRRPLISAL